jgi:predicted dehydrogenase
VDGGADATPGAVREGEEAVGPVVGDDIWAGYGFDGGVSGSYESARAADGGSGSDYFRLELCGTGGTISIWSSPTAPLYFCPRSFALPNHPEEWEAIPTESVQRELVAAGGLEPAGQAGASAMQAANQLLVVDLLAALEEGREPLSSGHDARAALEMIMAVYWSHMRAQRVPLPLAERAHPLQHWDRSAADGLAVGAGR